MVLFEGINEAIEGFHLIAAHVFHDLEFNCFQKV